ncbi:deoxyribonuclease V [Rubrobacter aplysinae]|uniref:deoxyribonuclease V n=1 Tax=Rubrobacter aplysinae TaxID=909625 RepID=UPI00064C30BE|nr:deoxyribonuclease V [Rubrobacter aplysinae]
MRGVDVDRMHELDVSPAEARRLQDELAPKVDQGPALDLDRVRYVAGADVSTQGEMGYAAVVVLSFPDLSVVEVQGAEGELSFPYVSGLLAFREIPPVVQALRKVRTPVDAVIFDSQGIAHPRRMGLASHLGLFLDVPSVGCAKTRLCGVHDEPAVEKGSGEDLVHRGEVVGRVLRTRTNVSPVYVSVGDRIDLQSAAALTLACCPRYRLPEPTRQAHLASNRLRKGEAL